MPASTDTRARMRRRQHLLLIGSVLLLEPFHARHRHNPGRDAIGGEQFARRLYDVLGGARTRRHLSKEPDRPAAPPHRLPPRAPPPSKLLLRAKEIDEIRKGIDHDKKTLIPLRIYLKKGLIKTELALAIGKKKGDKRQAIKSREASREATSAMRRAHKG